SQPVDCESMNSSQQTAVAPFRFRCARVKLSAQNESFRLQREQARLDLRLPQLTELSEGRDSGRPADFHSAPEQLANRVRSLPIAFQLGFGRSQHGFDPGFWINRLEHRQTLGRYPECPRSYEASGSLLRYKFIEPGF